MANCPTTYLPIWEKRSSESSFKNQAYFLKKDTDFSPAKAAILGGGYAFFATLLQGTIISSMEQIPWNIGSLLPVGIYEGMPIFQIIITILILGVVVPIGEEYLFRGIGFRESKRLFSPLAAIILSAIPFTLAHMGGINIYHAGFLGILLAALYYYTGNIRYPIIAHITNNIFAQLIQANQALYWIILALAALCFILSIKYLMEFKNYKSHPEFDIVSED